ncbi:hypothetical protein, partial [Accumulibacter sp.]|uniref:hypothetical protein n=1 Tax=Accumulibacter sp. TaxID=2053492 RepID=UPI0028C45931
NSRVANGLSARFGGRPRRRGGEMAASMKVILDRSSIKFKPICKKIIAAARRLALLDPRAHASAFAQRRSRC